MKRQILISSLILLFIQTLATATVRLVPQQYSTIQSAISAASNGDIVVVDQGTYSGDGNTNLDFHGKAIIVISQVDPNNPDPAVIANTVIDCGSDVNLPPDSSQEPGGGTANRAFRFHSGEGSNSKVIGFTIRNGYTRGPKGADGEINFGGGDYWDTPPYIFREVPIGNPDERAPYALNGDGEFGHGYGGAILCQNASSPTIKHCVITNNTVTGAHGGKGADGQSGVWWHYVKDDYDPLPPRKLLPDAEQRPDSDGQWGGDGGRGAGNGYGGAIACLGNSDPIISNCTISNNYARGGRGGDGGNGGNAVSLGGVPPIYDGFESFGGNAGASDGNGIGGGIYAEDGSSPIITNCTFTNNIAISGISARGGSKGIGNEIPEEDGGPAPNRGADGEVFSGPHISGGAADYNYVSANVANAYFTNCTFTGNKAYKTNSNGEGISQYTVGGALHSKKNNTVILDNCTFTGNLGGAVYCGKDSNLDLDNCSFTNNSGIANGGAAYIDSNCSVDINSCTFGGNSAYNDGGALRCRSNVTFEKCLFGSNRANSGYGGAAYIYQPGTTLTVDFNACTFASNQALYGGGFSCRDFNNIKLTDCSFIDNIAERGGGLYLNNGSFILTGGNIKGNIASNGYGGGFNCNNTTAEIRNCSISDNSATGVAPSGGNGGAFYFYGELSPPTVFNCLITDNSATVDGGAIFCRYASPNVGNCTFSGNSAGSGGAILVDYFSSPNITDCIFKGCNGHAIHEKSSYSNPTVRYCLFFNNPNGDYYDYGTGLVYTGDSIPGGVSNLYGDPLFTTSPLGNFYLSQIAAGQAHNSPAIDNGSNTAASLGLDVFTTRTDNVGDAGQVDRGYHYSDSTAIEVFQLTASVIGGSGTISPTSGSYYAGTIVTLTATPNPGWRVKRWSGTNNDSSTSTTNIVIMNSDKNVGVEFDQPRTLYVAVGGSEEGYYSTIQAAVAAAEDGDTIVVYPGVYYGGYLGTSIYIDKSITISSETPDDPCCVAATIIDGYRQSPFLEGHTNDGVVFGSHTDANTIFNGLTIRNCGGRAPDGLPGRRADPYLHPNGYNAGWGIGIGVYIYPGGGPVIKNCVIRNNLIIGGNGGSGEAATTNENAGRGGWGGYALGGAVFCHYGSSPTFINCRIIDNEARGGNGGRGGNDAETGGEENYGGSWSIRGTPEFPAYDINPYNLNIVPVTDRNLWEVWNTYQDTPYYFGDYRWYSGYGGGVFIYQNCNVTFIDCEISGNRAKGGMSGQGGEDYYTHRPAEPLIPFEIPSFGGGVYCGAHSTVTFTGCTITNNISSEANEPPNNRIDPYLGHGGGICAEDTATLIFSNCTFSGNDADAGGGLQSANTDVAISDCNFTLNSAFHGGGLFVQHGVATILRCDFTNNIAAAEVNEPNAGSGGGLHLIATEANIVDCNVSSNLAEGSGGGVFLIGENDSSFKNCLLTNNSAGMEGGAISSSIFSSLAISNCTIADNTVIGVGSYGGGLYCSYNSYTNIIDSIFWDNSAQALYGPQIAMGVNSGVDIFYSDVQGGQSYIFIGSGCSLNWGAGNLLVNPLFITGPLGSYYLSHIATGQASNSLCVNSGSDTAKNLGMNRYTTRTDEQPDRKKVDMGYHYPFSAWAEPCRYCELFRDGIITFRDFAVLALKWLKEGCSAANGWCQHADVTLDTYVDYEDIELFADCWLAEDTGAPLPNPSNWAIEPYPSWSPQHPNSISMSAQTASDPWNFWIGNVQYYFDCVSGGCRDSGWQNEPSYIDSGLTIGIEYGYRVRARDSDEPNNQTGWSPIRYAIAGEEPPPPEDHNKPTPNPATWATVPYATTPTSIAMVATTATDISGVEYYFEDFDSPAVNSGWQSSPAWQDTSCEPETTYRYRVRVRDKSTWHNTTDWSTVAEATTPEEGEEPPPPDTNPPAPVAWEVPPYETGSGWLAFANMTAAEAIDAEGNGVWYYFECVSIPIINSGWMAERVWNDVYIGRENQFLHFHFRVSDNYGNMSDWSTSLPCY
jgi:hypothetical protein